MVAGLDIETAGEADKRTLTLRGELDMQSAPRLEAALERLCEDGTREVVLDLRDVAFIDSMGLRALLRGLNLCKRSGCAYFLGAELSAATRRLFVLTGVSDLFAFKQGAGGAGSAASPKTAVSPPRPAAS